MHDEQKIRKFESEVLDEAHVNYAFYKYSEDIVIPYLLQVYGDTERHRDNLVAKGHNAYNVSVYLNNMMHGISCKKEVFFMPHAYVLFSAKLHKYYIGACISALPVPFLGPLSYCVQRIVLSVQSEK